MAKHSESSDCSEKDHAPNSPPYVIEKDGKSTMRFAIFNRTKLVGRKLLRRTLRVIQDQIDNHFYRYWSITCEFRVIKDQCEIKDWSNYVYIILVDELKPAAAAISRAAGIISGVHVQVSEIKTPVRFLGIWGADINFYIEDAPPIPNGISYAVIPMGTADSGYGVYYFSTIGDPNLPPTFEGLFSLSFDHETITLLSNPTQNDFTSYFGRTNNPNFFYFFPKELPDATEFNPGYQSKKYPNLYLSNFTFPSFWNPYGQLLGPFDFLGILKYPLIPFTGQTGALYADYTGTLNGYLIFSFPPPDNPNILYYLNLGPIFLPVQNTITSEGSELPSVTIDVKSDASEPNVEPDADLERLRTMFLTKGLKVPKLTAEVMAKLQPFKGSLLEKHLMSSKEN